MSPNPQEGSASQGKWLGGTCRGTHFPTCSPCAQRMLHFRFGSAQTQPKGNFLARKQGTSLPSMVIPHSISFTLFYLLESAGI